MCRDTTNTTLGLVEFLLAAGHILMRRMMSLRLKIIVSFRVVKVNDAHEEENWIDPFR